jgi:hypothetical protein
MRFAKCRYAGIPSGSDLESAYALHEMTPRWNPEVVSDLESAYALHEMTLRWNPEGVQHQ